MQHDPLGLTKPYPVSDTAQIFQGDAGRADNPIAFTSAYTNRCNARLPVTPVSNARREAWSAARLHACSVSRKATAVASSGSSFTCTTSFTHPT